MRDAFFMELLNLIKIDSRVMFITGDLGYKLYNPLKEIAPDRVINFGIREASMIGFASGLARNGMLPFVYSIVPFITLRSLEQIKIDLCYNTARVVIVGVGGGFSYGPNGPTHFGIEDIGIMRMLPGMSVWTPADPAEVKSFVRASPELNGSAYLRLGRNGEPNIHQTEEYPVIDKPIVVENNDDGVIVTCGFILSEVLKAAEILKKERIFPTIVQLPIMSPFPVEFIQKLLDKSKPLMTVEEHIAIGGLGQQIAEIIAKLELAIPFRSLAIPLKFCDHCLDRKAALLWSGLNADTIAMKYKELYCRQ